MVTVEITQKGVHRDGQELPIGHKMQVKEISPTLANKCRVVQEAPKGAQMEVATPVNDKRREHLRARYKELAGEDAPGRMKDDTLERKIEELEADKDADSE